MSQFNETVIQEIPVGSIVERSSGAYYPTQYARVTGHTFVPSGRFNNAHWIVECAVIDWVDDSETGETFTIDRITEKGIGTRIIKLAAQQEPKVNRKSPWFQE